MVQRFLSKNVLSDRFFIIRFWKILGFSQNIFKDLIQMLIFIYFSFYSLIEHFSVL